MEKFISACMEAIFSASFPGKAEIYEQYKHFERRVDLEESGFVSVKFTANDDAPKAAGSVRVPVSAIAKQKDGTHFAILIHILNGVLSELEVYSLESEPLLYEEIFSIQQFIVEDACSYPRRFIID